MLVEVIIQVYRVNLWNFCRGNLRYICRLNSRNLFLHLHKSIYSSAHFRLLQSQLQFMLWILWERSLPGRWQRPSRHIPLYMQKIFNKCKLFYLISSGFQYIFSNYLYKKFNQSQSLNQTIFSPKMTLSLTGGLNLLRMQTIKEYWNVWKQNIVQ